MPAPNAMTIGQLSRRTAVSVKVLRDYERLGLLYTLGRSQSNYRLFDESALWCVQVVQRLRGLGLSLKEIQELATRHQERPDEPLAGPLGEKLEQARRRSEAQIAALQVQRQRILDFVGSGPEQEGPRSPMARLLSADPRRGNPCECTRARWAHPGSRESPSAGVPR